MISKIEILEEIKNIRKKTILLSNTSYNFEESSFWSDIDNKLEYIQEKLEDK